MGSTIGGFLIGFGACLLIFSLGGLYGSYTAYYGAMGWVDDVSMIYNISHSDPYVRGLNVMRNISAILGPINNIIRILPGISQNVEDALKQLSYISTVSSYMESIQVASERAVRGMAILGILPWIFIVSSLVAVAMIAAGLAIVRRGARGSAV
ncbi:MAG: hypothetical protein QXQ57_03135 [Sulfolobales archaeon]